MNKLIKNAEDLPLIANTLVVDLYTDLLKDYPIIEEIKPDHWDFVLTIAGSFVAVSLLDYEKTSEYVNNAIFDVVNKAGIKIYPDFVEVLEDCRSFVNNTYDSLATSQQYDSKFLFLDSLGIWIVWNLFGHEPSNNYESNLIRILGGFIVHSFVSYWK
jgi:hypothetical protein